jgi:hypothetical protein
MRRQLGDGKLRRIVLVESDAPAVGLLVDLDVLDARGNDGCGCSAGP